MGRGSAAIEALAHPAPSRGPNPLFPSIIPSWGGRRDNVSTLRARFTIPDDVRGSSPSLVLIGEGLDLPHVRDGAARVPPVRVLVELCTLASGGNVRAGHKTVFAQLKWFLKTYCGSS